jgi:hypothetical protein
VLLASGGALLCEFALTSLPLRSALVGWRSPAVIKGWGAVALFDLLTGRERGASLWKRSSAGDETFDAVAKPPALELRCNKTSIADIATPRLIESDPAYVGVSGLDPATPFDDVFAHCFYPLLGKRAEGFKLLFARLGEISRKPLIIETGALRLPANWEGDGQSTFMFDLFVRQRHGTFYSIDINPTSIQTARRTCSSTTNLINNDSIFALNTLSETMRGIELDLLYLDSFDLDVVDPMPSAIHHALELLAARPLISAGTMICVDDYAAGDTPGGKGLIIEMFLRSVRAVELYSGYQKIWVVR